MRRGLFNKVDFCIRLDGQFEWCCTGIVLAVSFSLNYNAEMLTNAVLQGHLS